MVCRENKARSAVMGLEKHLYAQSHGGRREPDSVFQSSLHEYGHAFEAVDNPTREQYHDFLVGFRQQLVNDPSIPDAEKYRHSHKQPGMVTRIDQEIDRVRTGKDENGRPLRPEQVNGGKHFAAMQRMSTLLNRHAEARDEYVENYARQTGISKDDALRRWDTLCARKPEERENNRISLRDNWQRDLAVSGMSSQHQADIMQSNVARDAIAVMEHERRMKVATLPSRPAISEDQRITAITTEQAKSMVKCDSCGQFGHEDPQCPHGERLDELNHLHVAKIEAAEKYARLQEAHAAAIKDAKSHPELTGSAALKKHGGDLVAEEQARKEYDRASRKLEKARSEFDKERGPVPLVSDAVHSVGYDRSTGLLEVTRPGYTRKSDGVTVEPKTYAYRMSPEQYDEMMASGSVGRYLSQTVGSKAHEQYKWENPAEAREATRHRQCPSCGQFAAMTSQHQCPVDGSMDSTEEAHWRERQRHARATATLENLPVSMGEATRRRQVLAQAHANLPGGGIARFPEVGQMAQIRGNGEVATGPASVQYLGHQVTARVYTWKDPRTGQAYTTMGQASCSCNARETCRHREHAGNVFAAAYRSQRVVAKTPGTSVLSSRDPGSGQERGISQDAPEGPVQRRSYERIRQDRADAASALNRAWAGAPNWRARATAPMDARTRQRVSMPTSYTTKNGDQVDLTSSIEAGATLNETVSERTGRQWVSVFANGKMMLTAPPARTTKDGRMSDRDRRDLGRAMGLRGKAPDTGVFVPNDASWRYEMLSRADRGSTDILGSRYVARDGEAYGPAV